MIRNFDIVCLGYVGWTMDFLFLDDKKARATSTPEGVGRLRLEFIGRKRPSCQLLDR
jgi:hypothetical protein